MSEHVMLSPSRRPRFQVCPGSVREEARYPDTSGSAAIDGTHTHTLVEHCLKNGKDPMELVGEKLTDHEGEFKVEKDRAERAKVATDYVRRRVQEIGAGVRVLTETRVDPAPLVGRFDMSGAVDIQIHWPSGFEIIDYKDGMAPVPADDPQLQQYAVGALASGQHDLAMEVWLTVIQPKVAFKGGQAISTYKSNVNEVIGWSKDLIREGQAVDDPNAPLVPGERQCKYCKHAPACSVRATHAMNAVGMLFSSTEKPLMNVVETPTSELSSQAADRNPADMTGEQLREAMEAAPLIRQFLEGVEKEAERRLLAGQSIPGLKIVNGRGSRKWNLDDEQIVEKLKGMGIPKDACYKTTVITPAQAEKVTWEKRDGTKMQLTERQLKRMEAEYVTHFAGKLTVALESDSRPAVTTDASAMFSAIEKPAEALPDFLATPDWLK